jgi:hypothetical protein
MIRLSHRLFMREALAQIAVSTLLRASSIGNRKFLHAEHCRYGTRDLVSCF